MPEFKISEEAANEQLDVLFDYYEIDVSELGTDTANAVKGSRKRLVRAVRMGRLEIGLDDNSVVTVKQTTRNGDELNYREIDGQAKTAMGPKDANDAYGREYALMGALCGDGEAVILKLKGPDLSVAECLGVVFLQA